MAVLEQDIAAFDRMRSDLETHHFSQWVIFRDGLFEGAFADFEAAAVTAIERFDLGPYLIRQVGAEVVQLPGGMVFTPMHLLGPGRL